jgi:hypothetical protein
MTALPRLELADAVSGLDEAVITINGREEDQIIVSCEGSLDLADRLIRYVNARDDVIKALTAAAHALRSYEYGNSAPDLAHDIAAHCDAVSKKMGAAA